MRNRMFLLRGILAASTLLFATQGAHAQIFDEKVMPGSGCQATFGFQAGDLNHYAPFLRNTANAPRDVTCTIVRDNTTNLVGTWSAAVTGNNPGGVVFCALYSYDEFGGFLDLGAAAVAAAGNFTLGLDGPGGINNQLTVSAPDSYYALLCNLPAGAELYSYRWAERVPTDANN